MERSWDESFFTSRHRVTDTSEQSHFRIEQIISRGSTSARKWIQQKLRNPFRAFENNRRTNLFACDLRLKNQSIFSVVSGKSLKYSGGCAYCENITAKGLLEKEDRFDTGNFLPLCPLADVIVCIIPHKLQRINTSIIVLEMCPKERSASEILELRKFIENLRQIIVTREEIMGDELCAECRRRLALKSQRCSRCQAVAFCSDVCKKRNWPEHRYKCNKSVQK
eukprot:TRINITY_DN16173_c0_g1_i1.p1 TRINITY_DN16173_c0_g1~~TRINITY_DN16173_c0_g1_i1.p1  ORF type:complete len:236 (-),score=12.98 TRINITY_DN16173_c0_g1_i1:32-700(-)